MAAPPARASCLWNHRRSNRYSSQRVRSMTMKTTRGVVLTGLVACGLAVMIGAAAAQQPAPPQTAPAGGGRGGGLASRMTGKIDIGDTKNMNMSRIRFEAGARTNWHLHSAAQLLL